jgi:predicted AlkP superfamily pyrophosphatase or phosphodiesterase
VTDLLYLNFKMPDYAGHTWNMDDVRVANVLAAVDQEIGSLAEQLSQRFGDGNFALIVTADHGQCPEIDANGGVRIDPIQLEEDVERALGSSAFGLVQSVAPSEIYLDPRALPDSGITAEDVAAFLEDYRYGENIGPYVAPDAIRRDRFGERTFAAVLPTSFIADLSRRDLAPYGESAYPDADPYGIPPITW